MLRAIGRLQLGFVRGSKATPPREEYALYMRSFSDDEVGAFVGANSEYESQEPAFLRQIERLATPCLVESPSRWMPRDVVGYRLFIANKGPDDRSWMELVRTLARDARYVVLLIGSSPGLEAELMMLDEERLLSKTVAFMLDRYRSGIMPTEVDNRWQTFLTWLSRCQSPGAADSSLKLGRCDSRKISAVYWRETDGGLTVYTVPAFLEHGYEATVTDYIRQHRLRDRAPPEMRSTGARLIGMGVAAAIGLEGARIYRFGTHTPLEIAIGVLTSAACFLIGVWSMHRNVPGVWRAWKVVRGDGRLDDTVLLSFYYLYVAVSLAHG